MGRGSGRDRDGEGGGGEHCLLQFENVMLMFLDHPEDR